MYQEIDKLLDEQRPILMEGGEMAQLIAMKEVNRLLDIRNELGRLTTSAELAMPDTPPPKSRTEKPHKK